MISIFGNNLASLVLAKEIRTRSELGVQWVPAISPHFLGQEFLGEVVDVGMVLIEATVTSKFAPISQYDFGASKSANPYVHHFLSWLTDNEVTLHEAAVKTRFRGELVEDFFVRDSLRILELLSTAERRKISSQIAKNKDSAGHPSTKRENIRYLTEPYAKLCREQLGSWFFELIIEPLLRKIHPANYLKLIASEHRAAWMPFHYPESVMNWLHSCEHDFKLPSFYEATPLNFSTLTRSMVSRLNLDADVTSVEPREQSGNPQVFFGNPREVGEQFRVTSRTQRLLQARVQNQPSLGRVVFLECFGGNPSTIFLADESDLPFRVGIRELRESISQVATVEFGGNCQDMSKEALINNARSVVKDVFGATTSSISLVRDLRYPNRIGNIVPAREAVQCGQRVLDGLGVLGTPFNETNSSINEQAVAALSVARKVCP